MSKASKNEADDLFRKREKLLSNIDEEIRRRFSTPETILFTDMVGSTQFYDIHGDLEGRQLVQNHNDLLFPVVAAFDGVVLKTGGDSIFARFKNPNNALKCAIEGQRSLVRWNAIAAEDRRISVRMGLDYGDVVLEEKDAYGDVVNTASRIESLAAGGEILISERLAAVLTEDFDVVGIGSSALRGKQGTHELFLVNWNSRDREMILREWITRQSDTKKSEDAGAKPENSVTLRQIDIDTEAERVGSLAGTGNPYLSRVMIHHPSMFFGRERIVSRIMQRLGADIPQSVSIVGERRIGKSSLLNYLRNPLTRRSMLANAESVYFVLVDFQGLRSQSTDACFTVILREIIKQLDAYIEYSGPDGFDGLRTVCEQISTNGCKLVLLFDEFEAITRNEQLEPEFFALLRSLANNFALAFVTATGAQLHDICLTRAVADSPFFNIFTVQQLGLLEERAARALITDLSKNRGIPLEPIQEHILEVGGTHPFFLQIACSSWYEHLDMTGSDADAFGASNSVPGEVMEFFDEEAHGHFEYILRTFSDEERSITLASSRGEKTESSNSATRSLIRKGYFVRDGSGVKLFCEGFRSFILSEWNR